MHVREAATRKGSINLQDLRVVGIGRQTIVIGVARQGSRSSYISKLEPRTSMRGKRLAVSLMSAKNSRSVRNSELVFAWDYRGTLLLTMKDVNCYS